MPYYGRGRSTKQGFLPVEHPFSQLHQNTGVFVIERSADGKTALVGSIVHIFSPKLGSEHFCSQQETSSTTEVQWSDIKF